MNKVICSALFFFLSVTVFSNTGDSIPIKEGKKQFGFVYSPEYAFRAIRGNAEEKTFLDSKDKIEIPKFGYSAGINFSYQLSNTCTFEIEALFSDKGERTKKYDLNNVVYISTQDKIPYRNSFVNHYYYLDVPFKINYYLISKKIKFYLTAGISANAFLFQKTVTTIDSKDGSSEKFISISHPNFQKVNFAMLAGLGMNYHLTDKYVLKLEPVYKRSITSIVNAPVKSYLYSAGINIGMAYQF